MKSYYQAQEEALKIIEAVLSHELSKHQAADKLADLIVEGY